MERTYYSFVKGLDFGFHTLCKFTDWINLSLHSFFYSCNHMQETIEQDIAKLSNKLCVKAFILFKPSKGLVKSRSNFLVRYGTPAAAIMCLENSNGSKGETCTFHGCSFCCSFRLLIWSLQAYRENMHLRLTNYPAHFESQCSISECCNVSGWQIGSPCSG